jgi:hypothetical protein
VIVWRTAVLPERYSVTVPFELELEELDPELLETNSIPLALKASAFGLLTPSVMVLAGDELPVLYSATEPLELLELELELPD